jgi:hypothetical protein
MLTPAPTAEAVAWKRATFRGRQWAEIGESPERLQKAIDDDVRWLADHPVRKRGDECA